MYLLVTICAITKRYEKYQDFIMDDENKKPTPPVWAAVAKQRMRELNLVQEDLLAVFNVKTRGAVGHYLSGRRKISSDQLIALCDELGLSVDDIYKKEPPENIRHGYDAGVRSKSFPKVSIEDIKRGREVLKKHSEQRLQERSMPDPFRKLRGTPYEAPQAASPTASFMVTDRGGPRKVPLISWIQAGQWSQAVDIFEPGVAEDWFWCPEGNPSENTYALKVKGDSMTAQSPTDRNYPHGSIIFVDPNKRVENGSRVVAKLPDQDEATFKIYKEDMGRKKLVPINTRVYDVIDITNMNVTICGVVIGSYMPE